MSSCIQELCNKYAFYNSPNETKAIYFLEHRLNILNM